MTATSLYLDLLSGRLHARAWGLPDASLVLCVPGLTGHARGFDVLGPALAAEDRRVVALDLRGRGLSEVTGPGTYGAHAHVRDVLAAADALGAARFDLVGWSMGALLGILVAREAPERLSRLALLDAAGPLDDAALDAVIERLARLDVVVSDPKDYVDAARARGGLAPWSTFWDEYFRAELGPTAHGWIPRTSRLACLEDVETLRFDEIVAAWPALTMPTLLVRCSRPIGGGLAVSAGQRDALVAAAPGVEVVEIDRDHYTLMEDPRLAAAVARLLQRPARAALSSHRRR